MEQYITGAELQTMREACGLTREEFAGLAGVQARTVKHWENGRTGVPGDVSALVAQLDDTLTKAAQAHIERARWLHAGQAQPVILQRYRDDVEVPSDTWGTMSAGMQGAVVQRMRQALAAAGIKARIVWGGNMAAGQDTPQQMLQNQAIPHRGDQPPAA